MPRRKRDRQEGRTWATARVVEAAALTGALAMFLVGAVSASSTGEPARSITMFVSVLLGLSFTSFVMFWHYGESDTNEGEGEQEDGTANDDEMLTH